MSVRQGLLALLATGPMYGAQLRNEFERRTGGTWPLNVGQVYTTLGRLERDGLVEGAGSPDEDGRIPYRLTAAGVSEVEHWWSSPVDRENTPRDELVIKLALAVTVPGVDVTHIVQTQRTATLRHLQDLARLKRASRTEGREQTSESADGHLAGGQAANQAGNPNTDASALAWQLVLENLIFAAEGEVRWLDHVEAAVARAARAGQSATIPAATPTPTPTPTHTTAPTTASRS